MRIKKKTWVYLVVIFSVLAAMCLVGMLLTVSRIYGCVDQIISPGATANCSESELHAIGIVVDILKYMMFGSIAAAVVCGVVAGTRTASTED